MRELNTVEVEDVSGGLVLLFATLCFVASHTEEIGCFIGGVLEGYNGGN